MSESLMVLTPCSNPAHGVIRSSHALGGNPKFQRGGRRSAAHKIAQLIQAGLMKVHTPKGTTPTTFGIVPKKRSMFLNDQDGDCVSAEAMWFIACMTYLLLGANNEEVMPDAILQAWCNQFGVLNGADLVQVCQDMEQTGIKDGANTFKEGIYNTVDYTQFASLAAAVAEFGVVKIGIDANALPSGAGNNDAWYAFGGSPGQFNSEDHCVAVHGFGTAAQCFEMLGQAVPAGIDPTKPDCLLLYTWSTVGVVDIAWINSTCGEAFGRASCIMNGTPLVVPSPSPVTTTLAPPPVVTTTLAPVPGTFIPPFLLWVAGHEVTDTFYGTLVAATAAAQTYANANNVTVIVQDSDNVVAATILPIVPPTTTIMLTINKGSLSFSGGVFPTDGTYDLTPGGTTKTIAAAADMIRAALSKLPG